MDLFNHKINSIVSFFETKFPGIGPVVKALGALDLARFSDMELEDLDRLGSQVLQCARQEEMRRRKLTFNSDWKRGPGNADRYCHPQTHWADHCRTLFCNGKKTGFASFPYDIGPEGITELAKCVDEGWYVKITGIDDIYFPGRTVAIIFQRGP